MPNKTPRRLPSDELRQKKQVWREPRVKRNFVLSAHESEVQVMTASIPEPKSWMSTLEQSSKKEKKVKCEIGQVPESDPPPMFVFRAIDPRLTRQLTISPPTHVDIKPRYKLPYLYPSGSPQQSSGRVMSTTKSNFRTQSVIPLQQKSSPVKKTNK